jgi:hypothetical protein
MDTDESENDVNNESVDVMVRAKSYLDGIPVLLQDSEYREILNLINKYILKNCNHKVIEDTIDITLDESKTIYYCEKCLHCFD